jgi:hypothetical protein
MPDPEKRVCPTCKGVGFLYHEETDVSELCNCKIAEMMISHLGKNIARAPTILESPLFKLPLKSGDPVVLDRTKDNLFIRCVWLDLLSHLKLCLWSKGLNFRFHIVTDERIKSVYVGNEAYKARSKVSRDDLVTNNSIADLVMGDYSLVLIRLGFNGHKNIAAPGVVKEALMMRDAAGKPTWIIEEPLSSSFQYGHFTWSEDLQAYIDQNFTVIDMLRPDDNRMHEQRGYKGAEEIVGGIEDVSMARPTPRATRPCEQAPEPRSEHTSSGSFDLPGDDQPKGGNNNKKQWKKKGGFGGSGGPV